LKEHSSDPSWSTSPPPTTDVPFLTSVKEKSQQDNISNLDSTGDVASTSGGDTSVAGVPFQANQSFSNISQAGEEVTTSFPTSGMEVVWQSWPTDLPLPDLLRHLCVLFIVIVIFHVANTYLYFF